MRNYIVLFCVICVNTFSLSAVQINNADEPLKTVGVEAQYLDYMPWGEPFINENPGYTARFTFTGKELDRETGYHYFGTRYYASNLSLWLSVELMSDKYLNVTPYIYCSNNPIVLIDPDGRDVWEINAQGEVVNYYKNKQHDIVKLVG